MRRAGRLLPVWLLGLAGCAPFSLRQEAAPIQQRFEAQAIPQLPPAAFVEEDERLPADLEAKLAAPLTVETAIAIALANNRAVRAELATIGIASGRLLQAGAIRNPEVEVGARLPVTGGDVDWELAAHFDLTSVILRGARTRAERADLDATRTRVAGSVVTLLYRVQAGYIRLQGLRQKQELWRKATATLGASYESAKALFDAGNLPEINLTSEQAAWEQAKIQLAEAELDGLDAQESLAQLLGLASSASLQLASALPETLPALVDDATLERRAIEASLELAEQRDRLRGTALRLGLAQTASWLPELAIGVEAATERGGWAVGPSLHATLPISGQQRGAARSYGAELGMQRSRYVEKAIEIRATVRKLRNRLVSSERRVHHYQRVVLPLRDKLLQQAVRQYNAMQLGVFQLLEARRLQIETSRLYLDALTEYWQARAALECALRGQLPAGAESSRAASATSSLAPSGADRH